MWFWTEQPSRRCLFECIFLHRLVDFSHTRITYTDNILIWHPQNWTVLRFAEFHFFCTGWRNLIIRKMRQSITQANAFFGVRLPPFTLGMLIRYAKYECNAKPNIHGLTYTTMRRAAKKWNFHAQARGIWKRNFNIHAFLYQYLSFHACMLEPFSCTGSSFFNIHAWQGLLFIMVLLICSPLWYVC